MHQHSNTAGQLIAAILNQQVIGVGPLEQISLTIKSIELKPFLNCRN
jgi:hypothetical protein